MVSSVNFCGNLAQKAVNTAKDLANNTYNGVRTLTRTDVSTGFETGKMGKFMPTAEQAKIMKQQQLALNKVAISSVPPMVG